MKIVFQYTVIAFFCCSFSLTVLAKQPTTLSATPVVVLFPYLADNPDFFELSATQKKQIARIGQESGGAREALDQSILDLRAELREELLKLTMNQPLISRLQDELLAQEKARLQLSVNCARGLHGVLTQAQWKTLIELATQ